VQNAAVVASSSTSKYFKNDESREATQSWVSVVKTIDSIDNEVKIDFAKVESDL